MYNKEALGCCLQTTLNHWSRPVENGSALENYGNDWTTTQASPPVQQQRLKLQADSI